MLGQTLIFVKLLLFGPTIPGLQHLALRSAAASLLQAFADHELELLDLRLGCRFLVFFKHPH